MTTNEAFDKLRDTYTYEGVRDILLRYAKAHAQEYKIYDCEAVHRVIDEATRDHVERQYYDNHYVLRRLLDKLHFASAYAEYRSKQQMEILR